MLTLPEIAIRRPVTALMVLVSIVVLGGYLFVAVVLAISGGTGLGRRLMETLLARTELATIDRVDLSCEPHNIDFYERFGFEPCTSQVSRMAIWPGSRRTSRALSSLTASGSRIRRTTASASPPSLPIGNSPGGT